MGSPSVPSARGIIIPIYEYSCQTCEHRFEALVRGKEKTKCPACGSAELERVLSLPAVQSEGTHALAMKAAKKRDKKQGEDRMRAQREYELSHND